MKISVGIVCKNEESNINEWVEYHKILGVKKIYFCDNNDIGDNNQFNIVKKYIDSGFIEYIDVRGVVNRPKFVAYEIVNNLLNGNNNEYICYLDIDEFLYTNYNNINSALSHMCDSDVIIINRLFTKHNTQLLKIVKDVKKLLKCGVFKIEQYPKSIIKQCFMKNKKFIKSFDRVSVKNKYVPKCAGITTVTSVNNKNIIKQYVDNVFDTKSLSNTPICILHFPYKSISNFFNKMDKGFSDQHMMGKYRIDMIESKLRKIYKAFGLTDLEFDKINKKYKYLNIEFQIKNNHLVYTEKTDIDYVFPYVDNQDPEWLEDFLKYYKGDFENDCVNGNVRQNNFNLLKYKLRTIERNMPWINNIYMIVQRESQVPDWIDTTKIKIIYHKDFIPEEFLPTYSSNTIEMFLHRIPGLNEKFIYSNDDFYITTPTNPDVFFRNGKPLLMLHQRRMEDFADKYEMSYISDHTVVNCCEFAMKETDKEGQPIVAYNPIHHDKPMLKSVNEYIVNKYKDEIYSKITRFRDKVNLMQYVFHYWNVFHNNYYQYRLLDSKMFILRDRRYIKLYNTILNIIENSNKLISIDFDKSADMNFINGIRKQFKRCYPNKSKFELYDTED